MAHRRMGRLLAMGLAVLFLIGSTAGFGEEEQTANPDDLSIPPQAQDGVWRMLVDDAVVYNSSVTMPVTIERVTYYPVDSILPHLSCGWQSDVPSRTLSVYRGEQILSFNIDTGQVVASDGREFYARTFYFNGTYYIPLAVILREYGGRMMLLTNDPLQIYRLTTGSQKLSDREMLVLLETMPAFQAEEQPRPPVNLLIRGAGSGVDRMLQELDQAGVKAAFFVTAADIRADPARILEFYVAGHSIGIFSETGTASEIRAANDLLQKLIKTRTPLVFAGGYYATQELAAEGYRVWNHNLAASAAADGLSIIGILNQVGWRVSLFFNGSAASAGQLTAVLNELTSRDQRLVLAAELTPPYQQ